MNEKKKKMNRPRDESRLLYGFGALSPARLTPVVNAVLDNENKILNKD